MPLEPLASGRNSCEHVQQPLPVCQMRASHGWRCCPHDWPLLSSVPVLQVFARSWLHLLWPSGCWAGMEQLLQPCVSSLLALLWAAPPALAAPCLELAALFLGPCLQQDKCKLKTSAALERTDGQKVVLILFLWGIPCSKGRGRELVRSCTFASYKMHEPLSRLEPVNQVCIP